MTNIVQLPVAPVETRFHYKSLADLPEGASIDAPVRFLFEEGNYHREYVAAYTKTRLRVRGSANDPNLSAEEKFWYRDQHTMTALYYLMDNLYDGRKSRQIDIEYLLTCSRRKTHQILKDAEDLKLVCIEPDEEDHRVKVVIPTVRCLLSYESFVFLYLDELAAILTQKRKSRGRDDLPAAALNTYRRAWHKYQKKLLNIYEKYGFRRKRI